MTNDTDMIRRMDAVQACQAGPSDEWSRATRDGYNQAATNIAMNMLRIPAVTPVVTVKPLIDLVEEFATAVFHLIDNSETAGPVDDPTITLWKPDFDEVCALLDRIEKLPSGSTEELCAGELLSANILAAITLTPAPVAASQTPDPVVKDAVAEAHDEQLSVWADELLSDLILNDMMELVDHEYDTKIGARKTIIAALKSANQAKTPQPTLADALAVPEVQALENMVTQAAFDACEVFSDHNDAQEAVSYMEQLLYAALRAITPTPRAGAQQATDAPLITAAPEVQP